MLWRSGSRWSAEPRHAARAAAAGVPAFTVDASQIVRIHGYADGESALNRTGPVAAT